MIVASFWDVWFPLRVPLAAECMSESELRTEREREGGEREKEGETDRERERARLRTQRGRLRYRWRKREPFHCLLSIFGYYDSLTDVFMDTNI